MQERLGCGWFQEDTKRCAFYKEGCFHDPDKDPKNPNNDSYRCYKARPRREGEFEPWMTSLCDDCNEAACNGCAIYQEWNQNGFSL